jgi:hypothetical protein
MYGLGLVVNTAGIALGLAGCIGILAMVAAVLAGVIVCVALLVKAAKSTRNVR